MSRVEAILRDGAHVLIRPLEPEDRGELADGFRRLSADSRFRRFMTPMPRLSERQLDQLMDVDHRDREALVATTADGEFLGVARYVRTAPRRAEAAIVVADDWQGHGLGTVLLDRLAGRAREEGVTTFEAVALASNAQAIALLESAGGVVAERAGTEVHFEIPLEPAPPDRTGAALRPVLRAFASGLLRLRD
jgi:RimJ/RimL family protein N-acetyltransferase